MNRLSDSAELRYHYQSGFGVRCLWVATAAREVLRWTSCVDLLVNNAGVGLVGAAEESSLEQAKSIFEVNLFSVIRMIKTVLPAMRQQRSGRIINVSSMLGPIPSPFLGALQIEQTRARRLFRVAGP